MVEDKKDEGDRDDDEDDENNEEDSEDEENEEEDSDNDEEEPAKKHLENGRRKCPNSNQLPKPRNRKWMSVFMDPRSLADEFKEVFENSVAIRLVSKDGKSKVISYIEFKIEADAEKTLEGKQGTEVKEKYIPLY
ncbi:hypothetical protein P7K49_039118 [Saguinus oedipus]|uniref:RRM domain-containing protein n=1 Tax=Saguinus oedipus TaxID=9490 RepID=A0ABQ9TGL1_SAGOE|nr:hypothetical protein P7K49_039118 [Saguinus oedipus]